MAEYDVFFLLFLNMHVALLGAAFSPMATFFIAWFILQCFVWCVCCHAAFSAILALLGLGYIIFSSIFFNPHSDNEQPNPGSFLRHRSEANLWMQSLGLTVVVFCVPMLMRRYAAVLNFDLLFGEHEFQVVSAHTLREALRTGDNFILLLLVVLVLVTALGCLRVLRRRFFSRAGVLG